MSNINSRTCRSAIALNNIGVILLEKKCFQAASETLKDATALIKSTLNVGKASRDPESLSAIDQKVHQARQRLLDVQKHLQKNSPSPSVTVDVFTSNNVCTKLVRKYSEEFPTKNKAFAFVIEDFDFRSSNANEALTSILLLNLGVAYYCLGKNKNKRLTNSRKGLHKNNCKVAMRLFRISHSLFSKQVEKKKKANEVPELLHVIALLLLSALIIRMLCDNQQPEKEARPFYSMLQHLRSWALKEASFGLANGAAAAA